MKINLDKKYTTIALYSFLVICGCILFFLGTSRIAKFYKQISDFMATMAPFFIGGALAYILNFILKQFEDRLFSLGIFNRLSKRLKKGLALLITYITAFGAVYLFVLFVLPQLIDSVKMIINNIDIYSKKIIAITNDLIIKTDLSPDVRKLITDKINSITEYLFSIASDIVFVLGNTIKSITSSIWNVFLGIVVSIYILIDKERFGAIGRKIVFAFFSERTTAKVLDFISKVNYIFGRFLSGKILDSFIIAILTFVVLIIFKMPYALLIAVVVGITNIIPFFGPFFGAIPSVILIFVVSPQKALWFLVIIFIIQQLDGNIIGPKILGDSMGISPFWILFSLLVFAKLFGFLGMIIGVPLFTVIYALIKELVENKLEKRGLPKDTINYISGYKTTNGVKNIDGNES